jgi:hypothetical protein
MLEMQRRLRKAVLDEFKTRTVRAAYDYAVLPNYDIRGQVGKRRGFYILHFKKILSMGHLDMQ